MLGQGDTVGVFQLESAGMRDAVRQMRADRFEDLIALVALYRPGPMANIPLYCARKLGREPIEYLHPALEPILKDTFGVITYQEQVQQIAKDLAGYTLAEADLLRRAMGKKIKSEMDAQRERFLNGAVARGVDQTTAIHDLRGLRQVRRIRLQQIAFGTLCLYQLSDRLSEGEPSGRIHRRLDVARYGQHRQAAGLPPRGAAHRRADRCRPCSMPRGVDFAVKDGAVLYSLVGAEECRRRRHRASGCEAQGRRALSLSLGDFARRIDAPCDEPAGA